MSASPTRAPPSCTSSPRSTASRACAACWACSRVSSPAPPTATPACPTARPRPCCTSGPGLANGLSNLHNAMRAHSPIVNIIGDHATYHRHYDAPLDLRHRGRRAPVQPLGADLAERRLARRRRRRRRRGRAHRTGPGRVPDPAGRRLLERRSRAARRGRGRRAGSRAQVSDDGDRRGRAHPAIRRDGGADPRAASDPRDAARAAGQIAGGDRGAAVRARRTPPASPAARAACRWSGSPTRSTRRPRPLTACRTSSWSARSLRSPSSPIPDKPSQLLPARNAHPRAGPGRPGLPGALTALCRRAGRGRRDAGASRASLPGGPPGPITPRSSVRSSRRHCRRTPSWSTSRSRPAARSWPTPSAAARMTGSWATGGSIGYALPVCDRRGGRLPRPQGRLPRERRQRDVHAAGAVDPGARTAGHPHASCSPTARTRSCAAR